MPILAPQNQYPICYLLATGIFGLTTKQDKIYEPDNIFIQPSAQANTIRAPFPPNLLFMLPCPAVERGAVGAAVQPYH